MAGTPLIKEGKRGRWGRTGQIVIPAAFIFPSLFLFVYLIYETARLSGEKIKHQFALDAAVFVEMTNYSDFLNRTAYVNGAFPMRIFDEGFYSTMIDCEGKSAKCSSLSSDDKRLWEILYKNGDFPRELSGKRDLTTEAVWKIGFGGPDADDKNQNPPQLKDTIEIITMDNANTFWINWDDANQVYKLYVQIYQLLGSVEDAQWSVLKRLSDGHNFLTKSYYLNTGEPASVVQGGAAAEFGSKMGNWGGSIVKPHCYQKMMFYGNKPTGSYLQPYMVYAPETPISLPNTISGCDGLFHLMTVKKDTLDMLKGPFSGGEHVQAARYGFGVNQGWSAPSNYFNHTFNNQFDGGPPKVHVTVGLGQKGNVWPDPTPKFQVRTYP